MILLGPGTASTSRRAGRNRAGTTSGLLRCTLLRKQHGPGNETRQGFSLVKRATSGGFLLGTMRACAEKEVARPRCWQARRTERLDCTPPGFGTARLIPDSGGPSP